MSDEPAEGQVPQMAVRSRHGADPKAEGDPERVLAALAAVQHLLFLGLLALCTVLAVTDGAAPLWVAAGVAVTLAWYALGLHLGSRAPGRGVWWLLGLTACWLLLVTTSPSFVWLGFPLWLLAGHFLSLAWGVAFVAAVLAVVLSAPLGHGHDLTVAAVLGPTVGAVFALTLSRGEHHLMRDSLERAHLVRSLLRAQSESEELQAELVATQRESGVLAERARLSRDIHDTLAQGFSSIVLLARAGRLQDEQSALETLARIERVAGDNLDEARRVVGALAPRDLDSGLVAALHRQVNALAPELVGELRLDGDVSSIPTTLEVTLLRTVQGALANVRSHAAASRVVITLSRTDDSVLLDVVDDGCGFDAESWWGNAPRDISQGGYGLRAIRTRLRELSGDLEVSSSPGEGTALSAWLPLAAAGEEDA
ncbi:sensor histidine kinase [Gephyromycinifex aptenodytis]|uniref:sensor histidine kinase n=1 Tax=Gephyromycinifex aptenodytis TaxID=2716227 RepID=UPI001D00AD4E|nr:sensor histidine kinase [Gephyromycinifex aptenodytis]